MTKLEEIARLIDPVSWLLLDEPAGQVLSIASLCKEESLKEGAPCGCGST